MVIEDSLIGLEAALGAKMNCVITYTGSTESQVRKREGKRERGGRDSMKEHPGNPLWLRRLF